MCIRDRFTLNANSGPTVNKYAYGDMYRQNYGKYDTYGMFIRLRNIQNKFIKTEVQHFHIFINIFYTYTLTLNL